MNESESKQRNQRSKRRDRAHQLQQEKLNLNEDGSGDEGDESPPRTSKDKGGRAKPRRRRNSASGTMDEVIIDGFAIMSFKTLEDVEVSGTDVNGMSNKGRPTATAIWGCIDSCGTRRSSKC